MPFQISDLSQIIIHSVCIGVLFIGTVSFTFLSVSLRNWLHLSILFVAINGLIMVAAHLGVNLSSLAKEGDIGKQLYRIQALTGVFFIFGIPFLLYNMLTLRPKWRKINFVLSLAAGVVVLVFTFIAFAEPDMFVSLNQNRDLIIGTGLDVAHGKAGIVYTLRDIVLLLLMNYLMICFLFELIWHRYYKYIMLPLVGATIAVLIRIYDMVDLYIYNNVYYYGYLNNITVGISLFIVLAMIGVLCLFTDNTRDMERIHKIESLGIFAGGIAHDFNNLLTILIGNLSILKVEIGESDLLRMRVFQMEEACSRAKGLTQQLLTFSKGGEPIKRVVSIKELLQNITAFILSGSNIMTSVDLDDDLYNLFVDKTQISQVVQNILLNAKNAMPDGGILEIIAGNDKMYNKDTGKTGDCVKIVIRDSGVGISAKNIHKVFDPYYTTKSGGTGLGLAIAYSIVTKHKGSISVSSKEGIGTTFTIELPTSPKQVVENEQTPEIVSFNNKRILIMDDEQLILDITHKMLTRMGFSVDTALHGEEVIHKCRTSIKENNIYNCIILDLTVPGKMGGKEAVEIINKEYPDAKTIVSSGYSNDPVLANYKAYGFDAMLIKPYKYNELNYVLQTVLK